MSNLFLFNLSRNHNEDLKTCLELMNNSDSLLLLENGVFWTEKGAMTDDIHKQILHKNLTVFALDEDVQARGITPINAVSVNLIDYSGFVTVVEKHRQTITY
ncbi:MAG: sulfurtransferase complex subunit TusB [Pseudomonadales bacterium]|nr:sulfurtransferase complex subunit TusB [Pseudomonadales bacterium]